MDRIDNRIENLRLVHKKRKCQNRKKQSDGELLGVVYKIKEKINIEAQE